MLQASVMIWGGVAKPPVRDAQGCGGGPPPLGLLERDISRSAAHLAKGMSQLGRPPLGCGLTIKNVCPLKAGSRQPGLAQRMRNLMPTNAETVSRRPEIVIVGHNQCQAEPVSAPCRFPRHQTVTLMTGVSTGETHWLGLALVMPNDDDFGAPRNGLGIFGH